MRAVLCAVFGRKDAGPKGIQNTQLCLIILGISVFLGVFVLELLVYIRPVFLYGKKEKGSYGFAGILFVGKKKTCGRSPFTNPVMIRIKQGSSVCSAFYGDIFMKVSRL